MKGKSQSKLAYLHTHALGVPLHGSVNETTRPEAWFPGFAVLQSPCENLLKVTP